MDDKTSVWGNYIAEVLPDVAVSEETNNQDDYSRGYYAGQWALLKAILNDRENDAEDKIEAARQIVDAMEEPAD